MWAHVAHLPPHTMTTTFLALGVLVVSISAQSSTSSSMGATTCAAQNVLDTCLGTTEGYVSLCSQNDYSCLCDKYTAIITYGPIHNVQVITRVLYLYANCTIAASATASTMFVSLATRARRPRTGTNINIGYPGFLLAEARG